MTNEEAYNIISEFCFTGYEDNKKPSAKLFNAMRELVCEVHENAELRDYKSRLEKENIKLKEEIEKTDALYKAIIDSNFKICNLAKGQKTEIDRLKAELEQSVKLPCKCDNCVYADFMSASAERFYCMEHRRYMNVGGYCSFGKAKQSLKGGAD